MSALRVRGPVLPDGEPRDLYVVGGRVTYEPQPGAETVAEGWVVPGLVDAHCHVGLGSDGAVDIEEQERVAAERKTAPAGVGADPFGLGGMPPGDGQPDLDPRDFQLPPEVAKFLK